MSISANRVSDCLKPTMRSWSATGTAPKSDMMFELATAALRHEDRLLHNALTAGTHNCPGGYDGVSRGLAYWVFETGLVYTVFKAWAPEMTCRWEHRYSDTGGKACDLVLFPSAQEGWAVEAKYWNTNSAEEQVLEDTKKLREANFSEMKNPLNKNEPCSTWRRFQMIFSWGDSTELDCEWDPFDRFLSKHKDISVVFVGAFPSHIHKYWGAKDNRKEISTGYFAMTIMEV